MNFKASTTPSPSLAGRYLAILEKTRLIKLLIK
jgi:hypothetical protein